MQRLFVVVLCLSTLVLVGCRNKEERTVESAVNPTPTATVSIPSLIFINPNLEDNLLLLLNQQRVEEGLSPLTLDLRLQDIARIRSKDMARNNYFSHSTPDGCDAFCLMDRFAVHYNWAGENIAWNNFPIEVTTRVSAEALWESLPHRENTLNPLYLFVGVGHASVGDRHFFTILFWGP